MEPIIIPSKEELEEAFKEYEALRVRISNLTAEERYAVCDMGYLNDVIKGYLVCALRNADFSEKQIKEALSGLKWALSEKNAKGAEEVFCQWRGW